MPQRRKVLDEEVSYLGGFIINGFTYMGSPAWQTITLETSSFVLNCLPVWTDQRRKVINEEVSYLVL